MVTQQSYSNDSLTSVAHNSSQTTDATPARRGSHAHHHNVAETGITEGGTTGAFRDVLAKNHARRGKAPLHLVDMSMEERKELAQELGMPAFRVKQLAQHYFAQKNTDVHSYSDFPAKFADIAQEKFFPLLIDPLVEQEADQGDTIKTLWKLFDDSRIESVLMKYPQRTTLCISSQVGCGMDCPFCATGRLGLTRNLSAGEILEQVRIAALQCEKGRLPGGPTRLSNIVFMGMGEALGNYKAMMKAIRQISALPPEGFGISARNITLSTVGVVPGIRKLINEHIPLRLAVSLHAPNDELRDELVPMNKRFNTTQVLDAAHDYYLSSKRRVSIEYALMRGINDQAEHARLLAKRLNHYGDDWVHVNPIPLNPIEGSKWTASKPEDEKQFIEILHNAGISATLRDTRGSDIDGACGQLAAKELAQDLVHRAS
ncbi:23S rRNA (adenine(2503)-C(2))-methyltransferase RlmN [Alloscardovia criceti]|uniref:23S rRNA (adenine(2503)-C(2))-methyltransferase RlmN n=1 Tax=Alloscardovia criceti TaxID=356828 RepID=UPI00037F00BE|nr:23S rRNA (adenine(2503)-C(2))-methyltransferase RlmN [Alloscardovia criceti]